MNKLLFLGLSSFGLSITITPFVRTVFLRLGLVDRPDGNRKFHKQPVPRVGGIAIALSYAISFALLLLVASFRREHMYLPHLDLAKKILPAAIVLFLTGLFDDIFGLRPWQKFLGQFGGAFLAYFAGVRILAVADHYAHWWSLPLTVLWLVGCTNAFNLIDGLDGLASGVGLLSTLTMLLAAIMQNNLVLAVATIPLAGALLGFLRYNYNPASIFLGDSGSLLLGFLLGCYGVIWSQKCATLLGMLAPIMAVALPVTDVALAITRRFLRQQPIFGSDRGHIHHKLLAMGLTPKRVSLVLYAVCGVAAALSLLQSVMNSRFGGTVVVFFCALIWFGIRQLKYIEFGVVQEMLLKGEFRRMLRARIRLGSFEDALSKAATVEDCWPAVKDASKDLGFTTVTLCLDHAQYEQTFETRRNADCWSVDIELPLEGQIRIQYPLFSPVPAMTVVPFLEILREQLRLKYAAQSRLPNPESSSKLLARTHAAAS